MARVKECRKLHCLKNIGGRCSVRGGITVTLNGRCISSKGKKRPRGIGPRTLSAAATFK